MEKNNKITGSKPSKLKLFNTGRVYVDKYKGHYMYIAAKSMAQAAKLASIALYGKEGAISVSEVNTYYIKGSWGNRMEGIVPIEPCVYMCDERNFTNSPFRVV